MLPPAAVQRRSLALSGVWSAICPTPRRGRGAERLAHAHRQRQDRGELAQGGAGEDVGLGAVVGERVRDRPGLVEALEVGRRQGRARADRPVAELTLEAQVGGLVVLLVALGVDERRPGGIATDCS